MTSVLIVDDDERLQSLIAEVLVRDGFDAYGTCSASSAKKMLCEMHFDIIIVDWMMPNESGIEFIKSIRNISSPIKNIPAIMLTALDFVDNKVAGLDAGFDDYIAKPFEIKELVARINSLLRRTVNNKEKILKFGNCVFNTGKEQLYINNKIVNLSSTELILLQTLCQRPNEPFSRAELAKKFNFQTSERTVDVQITRLRKKIGDNTKNPTIIKTIRYTGYLLSTLD